MVRVPEFQIPPPFKEKLPEIVEAEIVRTPALLKAPPLPEVKFAPDTVTPEIERLPKLTIEKTLKLPLLPLILRVFAPGPVMVRVPAVPPPLPLIGLMALTMVGNAEAKVMV